MADTLDQAVAELGLYFEQVDSAIILFVVADDIVLLDAARSAIAGAVSHKLIMKELYLDPRRLGLLDVFDDVIPNDSQSLVLSVYGLETLTRDMRTEAIRLLNLQRNRIGRMNASIILWITRPILREISELAPDFYSWRTRTFFLIPPSEWDSLNAERSTYLRALMNTNEYVNLQGLAPKRGGQIIQMRMDDIFVPIGAYEVRYTLPVEGVSDIHSIVEERDNSVSPVTGQTSITDIKHRTEDIEEITKRSYLRTGQRVITGRYISIDDLLNNHRAVVLGDPGSGKTTLLRYIAYSVAKRYRSSTNDEQCELSRHIRTCIPIHIRIGDFAQFVQQQKNATLEDFIPIGCQIHGLPISTQYINHILTYDQVLFLLDGLDEVLDTPVRQHIVRHVQELSKRNPRCPIIVTSRIVGYHEAQLGSEYLQYQISPFGDEDIKRFVHNWYKALEDGGVKTTERQKEIRIKVKAKSLIEAISSSPSLERLATNPLLLTVIALMHWRGTKLPEHRATLYREAAETLVEQWPLYRGWLPISADNGQTKHQKVKFEIRQLLPESWDPKQVIHTFLPEIAWHIHNKTSSGISAEKDLHKLVVDIQRRQNRLLTNKMAQAKATEFLKNVSQYSGIFSERGLDENDRPVYGFLHLTFEEYFAARRLSEVWQRKASDALKNILHNPRWEEILLLSAGHFSEWSQHQATRFVRSILENESAYEDILKRDILLSAHCLADDVIIDQDLHEEILFQILNIINDKNTTTSLGQDVGHILSRLSQTKARTVLLRELTRQLRSRRNLDKRKAIWALASMGQISGEPDLISSIIRLSRSKNIDTRVVVAEALGPLGMPFGTPVIFSSLLDLLQDNNVDVRNGAVDSLGMLKNSASSPKVINTLLRLLQSRSWKIRASSINTFVQLGKAAATPDLIKSLVKQTRSKNLFLSEAAITALGAIEALTSAPKVLSPLQNQLKSSDSSVVYSATSLIKNMGEKAAIPEISSLLTPLINHNDMHVRFNVGVAIAHMGHKAATPEIVARLQRRLVKVKAIEQWAVAYALGSLGHEAATPKVIASLMDILDAPTPHSDWGVPWALGRLGQYSERTKVVSSLMQHINSKTDEVRWATAQALGYLGEAAATSEVIHALSQKIDDDYISVRHNSAISLSRLLPHYYYKDYKDRHFTIDVLISMAKNADLKIADAGYVGLREVMAAVSNSNQDIL